MAFQDQEFPTFEQLESRLMLSGDPLLAPQLVDDGAVDFAVIGSWSPGSTDGYQGDSLVSNGSGIAVWTFEGLTPGYRYQVAATWSGTSGATSQAEFVVIDHYNDGSQIAVSGEVIDQTINPNDFNDVGVAWENIASASLIRGTSLSVELSGLSSGQIIADAVRIVRVGEYVAPAGVPTPEFGVDESHWMYTDSQYQYDYGNGPEAYRIGESGPYTHYVDASHSNATDSGNPFGTPDKPRVSVPTSLSAGSVVEIHGGPYTSSWSITGNGTAANPIFVRGPSRENLTEIRSSVSLRGQYVILENILQTVQSTISVSNSSSSAPHHIAVRHCEQAGTGTVDSGISMAVYGNDGLDVHHVVLYDNYIHDQGDSENKPETDRHGMAVTRHTNNIWVLDNHVRNSQGDSIQINGWANETTHHIYIGRNTFHDDGENAIDIKEASDVIISENIMFGYDTGEGAVMAHRDDGYDVGPERVWAIFNHVYDANDGIVAVGIEDDFYAIGNVIHDVGDAGLKSWSGGTQHLINNTIYNFDRAIAHGGSATVNAINNILANPYSGGQYIYNSAGGEVHDNLQIANGDSLFVDASGRDFRLVADAPAVDAGADVQYVYDAFMNLYGLDIQHDVGGIALPQGGAVDLGAWEYVQGSPNPNPDPDPDPDVNHAPIAAGLSISTEQDKAMSGQVTANDSDGDSLTFGLSSNAAHGSVTMSTGGAFTYTPETGYSGGDSFTFVVSDGRGGSDTASVAIAITPAPQPDDELAVAAVSASSYESPNAPANTVDGDLATRWSSQGDGEWITFDLGSTKTVNKLSAAWLKGDQRSSSFDIQVSMDAVNWIGVYSGSSSGTTTGLEAYSFSGVGARYVRIVGRGNSSNDWNSIAEVVIHGTDDQTPVTITAKDDSVSASEDIGIFIDVLDNDASDNGVFTIDSFTQPSHGTLGSDGTGLFAYIADPDWNGSDSFTYTVSNGAGAVDTATVNIDVAPVNDAPETFDDSLQVTEGVPATTVDVLANDADVDGDVLSIIDFTQPLHCSVQYDGNGRFTYLPDPNYSGSDSFTYTVSDGKGGTAVGTVDVTVNPVNDDPLAQDDTAATEQDTPVVIDVLANDSDVEGEPLNVTSITQPANGSVVNNGDGTVTYTPGAGWSGTDSFSYTIADTEGGQASATVSIEVAPGGQIEGPLSITDVTASSWENSNIPANTIDGDLSTRWSAKGDGQWLQYDLGSQQTVEAVHIAWLRGDRRVALFEIQISPDGANWTTVFNGQSDGTTAGLEANSFAAMTGRYVRIVGHGNTSNAWNSIAEVEIHGRVAETDSVAAADDVAVTDQGQSVSIAVLDNDFSSNGTIIVESYTQPTGGTVTSGGNGELIYTPDAGWSGTESFTYVLSNGAGQGDIGTVSVTVNPAERIEGKLDVASVTASSYESGNVSANTIDGDLGTRWSANGDGESITYDLGSVQTVTSVNIAWLKGDKRQSNFEIEVSLDGTNWTSVYAGQSSGTTAGLESYSFGDTPGRYVRIVGHGNSANSWNSILEVELIGLLS